MKPETKFRHAVVKLAQQFGLEVEVREYMSGYDSAARSAWKTFSLKSGVESLPSEFLVRLEQMNQDRYEGVHAITGCPAQVSLAVRYINLANARFNFFKGQMIPA